MNRRRWLVVLGALLVQTCLGAIYGWGVFVPALKASRSELVVMLSPKVLGVDPQNHAQVLAEYRQLKQHLAEARDTERDAARISLEQFLAQEVPARIHVSESVWARHFYGFSGKQAQAVFSTGLMTFAMAMIFAGRWQDKVGPRKVAMAGGLILASGYAIAAVAGPSFPAVLLSIGVIGGAGIGCGYVCPIAACVKWFPDLKGPITGLAVAGFGGGAYLFIKLAGNWGGLLATQGVPTTFLAYAAIFAIAVPAGALLLRNPPPGWKPEGWQPSQLHPSLSIAPRDFDQRQTLRTRAFFMIWLAFMFASSCGLMIIGSLKDFGVREGGLSEGQAEAALGLLALFNAAGRIAWGSLSQRLGVRPALVTISLLQAFMALALIELGSREWTLELAACWVGFMFGGNLALFPLLTAEFFGTKNLGANYGLVFTAYGAGGVLGPMLAGGVWDQLHSYRWAFIAASAGCLLAMSLAFALRPPRIQTSSHSIS